MFSDSRRICARHGCSRLTRPDHIRTDYIRPNYINTGEPSGYLVMNGVVTRCFTIAEKRLSYYR